MAIETIGDFQLHLLALQLPESGEWDPFLTIHRFDEARQDFVCIVEKHSAAPHPFPSYEDAIEAARRRGNALILSGTLRGS